jgi:LysM repeat protein
MRPLTLAATALLAFCTSSCELFKPKEAAAAAYDPYGQQSNPYGQAPASNPYGQAAAPAPNPYGQTAAPNPYGSYEQPQTTADPSPYTAPAQADSGAADSGRTVTVQSGDTLTSIARRNGTNVAALRSANGLSGDLIKIGQKLNLP